MKRASAILAVWLIWPAAAGAHRLDEYLQASRLGIDRDGVKMEIDLTPGVSVADQVFGWIDTDRNGRISAEEADAYARSVLEAITLEVDGRRQSIALVDCQTPSVLDMRQGIGTIRLRATAAAPRTSTGSHRLVYRNLHRPDVSVYLVNALLPDSRTLAITAQHRDVQQHELRVEYQVAASAEPWLPLRRLGAGAAAASVLTALVWGRRRMYGLASLIRKVT